MRPRNADILLQYAVFRVFRAWLYGRTYEGIQGHRRPQGAYIERYAMHAGDEREDAGKANSSPVVRAKQARQRGGQDERSRQGNRPSVAVPLVVPFVHLLSDLRTRLA